MFKQLMLKHPLFSNKNKELMMKKMVLLLVFGLIAAIPATAQQTWKIDQSHSNVMFTVSHLVVSDVTGYFKEFEGKLTTTKDDFSDAMVDVSIKIASINTDIEKRDNHLKSDDFFNAEKFPMMTFTSRKFEKTGNNTFKITGDLTIRDVTKEVVLDAKYKGQVVDPWGNTKAGWVATTIINRFDYNLKWNAAMEAGGLVVGENVDIRLNMELGLQKPDKMGMK